LAYWLLKTEPAVYSYDDLEQDGKTISDGITNNLALKYLRSTKKGDLVLIYHTGDEKQAVGIAELTSNPYPDPKQKNPRLVVVDLKPKRRLNKPVTLTQLKAMKEFKDFELVRLPRLSVIPVDGEKWKRIVDLAK